MSQHNYDFQTKGHCYALKRHLRQKYLNKTKKYCIVIGKLLLKCNVALKVLQL